MLRRALKHAALAAALVIPTLAGVVAQAPAAHAGAATMGPDLAGETVIDLHHTATDQLAGCGSFERTYIASVTGVSDPLTASPFTGLPDYHYAPGASVTVKLQWDGGHDDGLGTVCDKSFATSADLILYASDTGVQGGTGSVLGETTVTINNSNAAGGSATATMYFSNTPFAAGGTQWTGGFLLGVALHQPLTTNSENGIDTVGDGSQSDDIVNITTDRGMFSTGYMTGFADAQGASAYSAIDSATTGTGKDMSLNRIFSDSWTLPGTFGSGSDVDTAAAAGRGVVWSIKPSGTHFVTCSGTTDTPWESVAAGCDDSGTYGLTSILSQLNTLGLDYGVPMMLAIEHEPHNNTSDWGTNGVGSCVAKGTCDGSSTEYRNMYAHVHSLLGAGDLNYPWVQLIYIAVDTNMSQNKSKSTGVACGSAGCGDIDRPADTDYDLLGADVYNYFKWVAGGPASSTSTTGGWNDIASDGNGSSRVNTTAKMGTVSSGKGDIAVAAGHKKHILMTELGTHPGCPGGGTGTADGNVGHCATGDPSFTKDTWFENFASVLTGTTSDDVAYQQWFEGFMYFNDNHSISTGDLYDWQFVDRTGNANNSESGCPSGVPCWTGLTGYKNSFVTDTSSNNSHSNWFLGTSTARQDFRP